MEDGNYSLELSLFFLYNRDTDNVGEQSFNVWQHGSYILIVTVNFVKFSIYLTQIIFDEGSK